MTEVLTIEHTRNFKPAHELIQNEHLNERDVSEAINTIAQCKQQAQAKTKVKQIVVDLRTIIL